MATTTKTPEASRRSPGLSVQGSSGGFEAVLECPSPQLPVRASFRWLAVKELRLSYHDPETRFIAIYYADDHIQLSSLTATWLVLHTTILKQIECWVYKAYIRFFRRSYSIHSRVAVQ